MVLLVFLVGTHGMGVVDGRRQARGRLLPPLKLSQASFTVIQGRQLTVTHGVFVMVLLGTKDSAASTEMLMEFVFVGKLLSKLLFRAETSCEEVSALTAAPASALSETARPPNLII